MMRLFKNLTAVAYLSLAASAFGFTVDNALPAGNITVRKVDGTNITIAPELRDTDGNWFYWKFRVTGAEGQTLQFSFVDEKNGKENKVVGTRGPVISTDEGANWRYHNTNWTEQGFTYTFGAGESNVWFSQTIPYLQKDWKNFVSRFLETPSVYRETLCQSRQGHDVETLTFGAVKDAQYWIVVTARHHAQESTASFVLEGLIEGAMASPKLMKSAAFFVVPFVDKDGVEAGDQGKNRMPRDHNRDYIGDPIYPETKAIREQVTEWVAGRTNIAIDLHCPWIRGQYNEFVYQVGRNGGWTSQVSFGKVVEKMKPNTLNYKQSDDLPFGKAWNTGQSFAKGKSFGKWSSELPLNKLATTFEIPFAAANGALVTPASARQFGRNIARALEQWLSNDAQPAPTAGFTLDKNLPAGNIEVRQIEGNKVTLAPEARDTPGGWFYWKFRVQGAQGQTLQFTFPNERGDQSCGLIGMRGPAVSTDEGASWCWHNTNWTEYGFSYTFGANETNVWFCQTFPYLHQDWERFANRVLNIPSVTRETLCQSRQGRAVEKLTFGALADARYRIVVTARHHAQEAAASFVLEGLLEGVLASPKLMQSAAFFVVPFVDKDGVEAGDQGKGRAPRDYNRDYLGEPLYPEIRAIREQVSEWVARRVNIAIDLHCPLLRGEWQEAVYQVGRRNNWPAQLKLGTILETIKPNILNYKQADDLPPGTGWNTGKPSTTGKGFGVWASELPLNIMSTTFEIPFASANSAPVTPDSARQFGRNTARALEAWLMQQDAANQ